MMRKTRVLLIYIEMIPSVLLAGHSQLQQIEQMGKIEYRAEKESNVTEEELNWADVVVYGRLDDWYAFELAKRIKAGNRKLIYMLDDDLLNISSGLSAAKYYSNPDVRKYISGIINLSDMIWSPSLELLKKYTPRGKRGVFIEEPALYPVEEIKEKHNDDPVKIGFAGSIDRVKDIEKILSGALTRIKKEYGNRVCFSFFGAIPSFASKLDAQVLPYCSSYEEYKKALNESEWDIGLAPMPRSEFHSCKHYIKYIEYAASGIVGVFSDEMPYVRLKDIVPDPVFCENTEDAWYSAIKRLIEEKDKRIELRTIALQQAHDTFCVEKIAQRLLKDALEIFEYQAPDSHRVRISADIRYQRYFRQVLTKIKVYGWKTPFMIVRKILKICYRAAK